jgi:hypothetical protein
VLLTVYCVVFGGVHSLWSRLASRDRRECMIQDFIECIDTRFYRKIGQHALCIDRRIILEWKVCEVLKGNSKRTLRRRLRDALKTDLKDTE